MFLCFKVTYFLLSILLDYLVGKHAYFSKDFFAAMSLFLLEIQDDALRVNCIRNRSEIWVLKKL